MGADQIPLRGLSHRRRQWLLAGCVLLAAALRWPGFFANSFHGDETLFATWSREIATGRDFLLTRQLVDKPPLFFYLQALFWPLHGPVAWAARWPNLIASLVTVPLIGRFSHRLWHNHPTTLIAALAAASTPFLVQFGPSGFTDPLAFALALAALVAAVERKPRATGLWLALALLTKYQAISALPLLIALAPRRAFWRRALPPLALCLVLWLAWMLASGALWRWGGTGDARLLTTLRPIYSWEVWPRWHQWHAWFPPVWGGPVALWAAAGSVVLWWRGKSADLALLLFLLIFALAHWLLALPPYDRYLFPLVLGGTLVLARALTLLWPRRPAIPLLAAALLLLPNAWHARDGAYQVGAHPRADHGPATLAAHLAEAPQGTVLYDHWHTWQWRYHLFDSAVYVVWMPHPTELLRDLAIFQDDQRWIALPATPSADPFRRALHTGGYDLVPIGRAKSADGLILYKIERSASFPAMNHRAIRNPP